jgi:PleD family two-component response regulator
MNLEENRKHAVLIEEATCRMEEIRGRLSDQFTVRVVTSPFKLLSMLCTEKPDVIVLNSSVSWFHTGRFCGAINGTDALAETPMVLYNTENTSVTTANVTQFRNCHIVEDVGRVSETARRLVS